MLDNSGRYSISPTKKAYTMEAETQLRQRVALLQNEFAVIDVNQDAWISREELYNYLDRKSGKVFDRAIADDIFEQMDKDSDNRVTINEFIKVYIQAEEILRTKIEKARIARDAYKKEEEEYLGKAQKASVNENYSGTQAQSGIAHVSIREAVIANQASGSLNLFVEVYLDKQQIAKTKVVPYDEQGARWEEKFAFDIPNPRSEVKLILYDRGAFVSGYFIGQANVPVSGFTDQELHQQWVNLLGKDNVSVVGQLLIELQWIYSKVRYYTSLAEKCRENYIRAEEDARDYELMLEKLHEPFSGMQVVHEASAIQSKYPGLGSADQKFVATMNRFATKLGQGESSDKQGAWQKLAILLGMLWLMIGILINFGRSDFFDVLVPIILIFYLKQGTLKEIFSLRILALIIIFSIIALDLVWAVVYWGDWEVAESQGIRNSEGLKDFVWLMSFICVCLKGITALVCYMLNIQTSMSRGSVKRPVMRNVDVSSNV